ncbi:MAG TPA: YkvA family protein [Ignavibacteriaceae bacterium]|nr:YkvA family protein [Ignavibacteriaceae bacterium]
MNNEEVDLAELGDLGELGVDELDFGGNIKSEKETEEKIKFVEENLWEKLERVGKKISFARDILALVNYMRDPLVSWHRKAIVVAGLIYFISPIDAIPDISPLIGYLDDLGVITAILKFLGSELTPYYSPGYRS